MGLPWVRLDSNIYSHDKILKLLAQRDGWRAFGLYTFALAYAGGHGTEGFIPRHCLVILQGTEKVAQTLVDCGLWEYAEGGWAIHNWGERQELRAISEAKRSAAQKGGRKRACQRDHGPECGCWATANADVLPLNRASNG